MKTAVAIRHVAFEDLGSLAAVLEGCGYAVRYLEAGVDDLAAFDPLAADLAIILGGPIGVYQAADYPFIADEIALARRRIEADWPTLGICLGAQIMAAALGANVFIAEESELGWAPVALTAAGRGSALRHLENVPVLHWHGDRFELPVGTERLAATPACPNQAFRRGPKVLALQFHPEVEWPGLEHWLIGSTRSLAEHNVSVRPFRAACARQCAVLAPAAGRMLTEWLSGVS